MEGIYCTMRTVVEEEVVNDKPKEVSSPIRLHDDVEDFLGDGYTPS